MVLIRSLLLSLPLLVAAHGPNGAQILRHRAAAPAAPSGSVAPPNAPPAGGASHTTTTSVAVAPSGTGTTPGAAVPPANTLPTTTWSLDATGANAVPLASLAPSATNQPTHPLPITPAAGAKPTGFPSAPGIPDISNWVCPGGPNNYPPMDKAPPTDHPFVQQWIQEVQDSGVAIPNWAPTVPGGCGSNTALVGNETMCWWTCGHCTRDTDVTTCPQKNTWGFTMDDGPTDYSSDVLNIMQQNNFWGTFFVVGSRVCERPGHLQTEHIMGHQIAVHTWSHTPLTTQTTEQIIAEFGWSKFVIQQALGVTPGFMRPPYGDIDDRVRAIAIAMGLQVVIWTDADNFVFDTQDWQIVAGTVTVSVVLNNFQTIMSLYKTIDTGFILLEHDLFQQTVDLAVGYFIPAALAENPKLTLQPVVQCIGLDIADAYIETNNNKTHPPLVKAPAGGTPSGATGAGGGGESAAFTLSLSRAWLAPVVAAVFGLAASL